MWTGLTDSPGVTVEPCVIDVPGVVTVPGLPGVVGGTGHRIPVRVPVIGPVQGLPGPGVTGTCSEYTGRLTDDC